MKSKRDSHSSIYSIPQWASLCTDTKLEDAIPKGRGLSEAVTPKRRQSLTAPTVSTY